MANGKPKFAQITMG